ncbi:unnamed protein product [Thelazia callipaeda]|uniref:Helicase ATP-binding domain-containing protein n=1 Tax=Thelazia callipaeda TaxID=103827 RepID=A0A0N5CV01_THECL|nr:unnamed protein product [Thelazia callipaeda]
MEPFGFTHLNSRIISEVAPVVSNRKYKKCTLDIAKLRRSQQFAMRRLFYPVNTPVCAYQKKLILDSLHNNILIALPKELDTFFVAAVTMLNFHRWFPMQKVLCICNNIASSIKAAKRFVEITGYSSGVCVYSSLKKNARHLKWMQLDIVFATAESIVAEIKDKEGLSEICLIVVEDAHRAMSGSHPLSTLIRNCIFAKATFRVLAYMDYKIDNVGQLQLIVMNLQIDLIRSLSFLKDDVSLTVASHRMQKVYVKIDDKMRRVAKELLKALEPLALLLCEGGVIPSKDVKKIANFSISYLQSKVQQSKTSHLVEIYCDFFDLLSSYNILMCYGLTAFGNSLQALTSRSTVIADIVQSNELLKEICFLPTISRPDDLQCYKLDTLVSLLINTRTVYETGKQMTISENMLKDGKCNVIIAPCGSDASAVNAGFLDFLICLDEGLCTLRNTANIKITVNGNLFAICCAGYETNIYSFMGAESTIDCIPSEHIHGLQLCNDVPRMLPSTVSPEIVEYWAENVDHNDGLLAEVERLDFKELLKHDDPCFHSKIFKDNCKLLDVCVKNTFSCQGHVHSSTLLGHSITTVNMTKILGKDLKVLEEQVSRLKTRRNSKWIEEDSEQSDSNKDGKKLDLRVTVYFVYVMCIQNSPKKCNVMKVPRVNRVESASFTLLNVLKPEVRFSHEYLSFYFKLGSQFFE